LAAGLRPDPLGELTALPRPPWLDFRDRGMETRGRKEERKERDEGKGRRGKGKGKDGTGRNKKLVMGLRRPTLLENKS